MAKRRKIKRKASQAEIEKEERIIRNIPPELYKAYLKVSRGKWESDVDYEKFSRLRADYLGDKDQDPIEQGRIVVILARMKMADESRQNRRRNKDTEETDS